MRGVQINKSSAKVNYDEFKRIFVKAIFRSCLLALIKEILSFNPFKENFVENENDEEILPAAVRATTFQRTLLRKGIDGENAAVVKHGRSKLSNIIPSAKFSHSIDILNSLADFKDNHHVYTDEELYEILHNRKAADTPSSLASDSFNYNVKVGFKALK